MSTSEPPQFSIVIPAWNEAARLPQSLRALIEFGKKMVVSEVIVVVEKSADRTLELAKEAVAGQANFRVIANSEQRGKGHAVKTGMLAANGELVFFMDADLSVPLGEVRRFLAAFAAEPEVDVLIGNRQHAMSAILKRQSWLRETMGKMFNAILRSLTGISLRDTQCGFKAFRREAARAIFAQQQIDGFAFDVELLMLAKRLGYSVRDLPVEWINSADSKVHIVRDSARMLRDVLKLRWRLRR